MTPTLESSELAARTAALLGALPEPASPQGTRLAWFFQAARAAGFEPVEVHGGFLVSAGRRRPRVLLDACVEPVGPGPDETAVLAWQGALLGALGLAALAGLREAERGAVLLFGDARSNPCEPAGPCTVPSLILGGQGGQGFQVGGRRIYSLGLGWKGRLGLRVPSEALPGVKRSCRALGAMGLEAVNLPLERELAAALPLTTRLALAGGRRGLPLPGALREEALLTWLLESGSNHCCAQAGSDEAPGQAHHVDLLPGLPPLRYLKELERRCGPLEVTEQDLGHLPPGEPPLLEAVSRLLSLEDPGSTTHPYLNPFFLPRAAAARAAGVTYAGFAPLAAFAPGNAWPRATGFPGGRPSLEALPFGIRVLQRLLGEVLTSELLG